MLSFEQGDSNADWMEIIADASVAVVAAAKWNIYTDIVPGELYVESDHWDSDDDKMSAQCLFRSYLMPRRRAFHEMGGY